MKYDKDKIKESLTINQIFDLCAELGGEPIMEDSGDAFKMKTICHNPLGEGSHKLYYYNNTHLFRCYTECNPCTFDIFQLYMKIKHNAGTDITLAYAISHIAAYFHIKGSDEEFLEEEQKLEDWKILENYSKIKKETKEKKIIDLKIYDDKILSFLPQPHIKNWENEGITYNIIKARGIKFNPLSESIIIPHYDDKNNLIGIRERTLVEENEIFGKYRPAILNGKMYNHPLGFALYGLNWNKQNIAAIKKVIIFEGKR